MPRLGAPHRGDRYSSIESHQPAAMPHRQCQEIDVGKLCRTENPAPVENIRIGDRDVVWPEFVTGVDDTRMERRDRLRRRTISRIAPLRHDPHESVLRKGACRPPTVGMGGPPRTGLRLRCMIGIEESQKSIHIKQRAHRLPTKAETAVFEIGFLNEPVDERLGHDRAPRGKDGDPVNDLKAACGAWRCSRRQSPARQLGQDPAGGRLLLPRELLRRLKNVVLDVQGGAHASDANASIANSQAVRLASQTRAAGRVAFAPACTGLICQPQLRSPVWYLFRMSELRKITVQVPGRDLQLAQEVTGEGVTETVRTALQRLAQMRAQQELRKLRGTFRFTIDLDQLREDRG